MRAIQMMTTAAVLAVTAGTRTVDAGQAAAAAAPIRIVALGDSLTSGHRLPRARGVPGRSRSGPQRGRGIRGRGEPRCVRRHDIGRCPAPDGRAGRSPRRAHRRAGRQRRVARRARLRRCGGTSRRLSNGTGAWRHGPAVRHGGAAALRMAVHGGLPQHVHRARGEVQRDARAIHPDGRAWTPGPDVSRRRAPERRRRAGHRVDHPAVRASAGGWGG